MITTIANAHCTARLTLLAAMLITTLGIVTLTANEPSTPTTSATQSGSDRALASNVIVPMAVVNRLFPELTQQLATGENSTAVGKPKATRSIIYANRDSSKKVTISVDQYASAAEASSGYDAAVRKSKTVPGFKPLSVPDLTAHVFIGSVTQGEETHIGLGALHGTFIVGATLAGYEPTSDNIAKLIELSRTEAETANATLDCIGRN